eukprot:c375_g1_i1 orf=375-530(-)
MGFTAFLHTSEMHPYNHMTASISYTQLYLSIHPMQDPIRLHLQSLPSHPTT